jgi:hypothetical protein
VQSKNFHVEAKSMLKGEKILLCTEPDDLTATQTGQTVTKSSQTAAQAGPTART